MNSSHMNLSLISRRHWLSRASLGFGTVGLAGLCAQLQAAESPAGQRLLQPHLVPRAKRVILLFMNGGPSHVDTFDPKPALAKHEGQKPSEQATRRAKAGYVPSPFRFRPYGESGVVMSELFPQLSKCADDLCVIRSMHTDVPNHEPGLIIMHSGVQQPTRPSIGSWVTYGLGTENQNLPGYVVLGPRRPVVGPHLWSNSFLPGAYQGMAVNTQDMAVDKLVTNLKHPSLERPQQRRQLDLLQRVNRRHQQSRQEDAALEARIQSFELAFRMQMQATDALDITGEPKSIHDLYQSGTVHGRQLLIARRLIERGVRVVQCYHGDVQPWDSHGNIAGEHGRLGREADGPIAAFLTDLAQRGLLDETLVVCGGEFGRTPAVEMPIGGGAPTGRDHNHHGFSVWLAGGGVRGGMAYGNTDEFGYRAVENRVHVHDLHATMLHLMGFDHERLTYHHSGRDFRLTDVHGKVVHEILS